jgi:hypothetical protein
MFPQVVAVLLDLVRARDQLRIHFIVSRNSDAAGPVPTGSTLFQGVLAK